jgi:hypothetical protein
LDPRLSLLSQCRGGHRSQDPGIVLAAAAGSHREGSEGGIGTVGMCCHELATQPADTVRLVEDDPHIAQMYRFQLECNGNRKSVMRSRRDLT